MGEIFDNVDPVNLVEQFHGTGVGHVSFTEPNRQTASSIDALGGDTCFAQYDATLRVSAVGGAVGCAWDVPLSAAEKRERVISLFLRDEALGYEQLQRAQQVAKHATRMRQLRGPSARYRCRQSSRLRGIVSKLREDQRLLLAETSALRAEAAELRVECQRLAAEKAQLSGCRLTPPSCCGCDGRSDISVGSGCAPRLAALAEIMVAEARQARECCCSPRLAAFAELMVAEACQDYAASKHTDALVHVNNGSTAHDAQPQSASSVQPQPVAFQASDRSHLAHHCLEVSGLHEDVSSIPHEVPSASINSLSPAAREASSESEGSLKQFEATDTPRANPHAASFRGILQKAECTRLAIDNVQQSSYVSSLPRAVKNDGRLDEAYSCLRRFEAMESPLAVQHAATVRGILERTARYQAAADAVPGTRKRTVATS